MVLGGEHGNCIGFFQGEFVYTTVLYTTVVVEYLEDVNLKNTQFVLHYMTQIRGVQVCTVLPLGAVVRDNTVSACCVC